jgi:hypothetical protein
MNQIPTSSRRDPPNITGGGDRYEALVQIMEQQAAQSERDRELEAYERALRHRRQSLVPPWVAVVLAIIVVWLWLFPPGFMRMDPPPPQPIEQEEAALRFTMYLQVQRIRGFQQEQGRVPATLEEAGPPLPAMEYHRLGANLYQLNGVTDRLRLTYRSDLPLDEFVGTGADVVNPARLP